MKVEKILEYKDIGQYITSHNILKQYKKAKSLVLLGDFKSVDFKKRRPYKSEKYYFKINNKYRAFCFFDGNTLKVFENKGSSELMIFKNTLCFYPTYT